MGEHHKRRSAVQIRYRPQIGGMAELVDALLDNRKCQPLDVMSLATHAGSSPATISNKIMRTMEWEYKKVCITVTSDGYFVFKINGKNYNENTLNGAKRVIDEKLRSYYNFTQADMDKMMSKLDEREQNLIRSLYQELCGHYNSAYCEQGISESDWEWNWDFDK